ncbi:kinase [Anaerobacillus sp. CMMVII]|uniref:AarF/UbiB family protein n=1 Tax=Anaerobacillus sp. CMMVII TaxID=2755588 RepID=UPI0021B7773F|nr:AarF/UbiB family protein [Anaerobacillus sp. CMMVII]MCT8140354.1 kinase [Anaerobacillus sp. CMMVII]
MKDDFKKIKVYKGNGKVKYDNPTSYTFIGRGYTGAVFKLSSKKCVKIFANEKDVKYELEALELGQHTSVIPKLYEVGQNYIVMEYISGVDLHTYLLEQQFLSDQIAEHILFCLMELKRLGFPRLDVRLRHFLFTKSNTLKVIDHAYALRKQVKKPEKLFKNLKQLGLLEDFFSYAKRVDPVIYNEWKK